MPMRTKRRKTRQTRKRSKPRRHRSSSTKNEQRVLKPLARKVPKRMNSTGMLKSKHLARKQRTHSIWSHQLTHSTLTLANRSQSRLATWASCKTCLLGAQPRHHLLRVTHSQWRVLSHSSRHQTHSSQLHKLHRPIHLAGWAMSSMVEQHNHRHSHRPSHLWTHSLVNNSRIQEVAHNLRTLKPRVRTHSQRSRPPITLQAVDYLINNT